MPELYTFITERTDNIEELEELKKNLTEEEAVFIEHKMEAYGKHYTYLSGHTWCEDCGYPHDLAKCFYGIEINCVFCNFHNYGIINAERMNNRKFDQTIVFTH